MCLIVSGLLEILDVYSLDARFLLVDFPSLLLFLSLAYLSVYDVQLMGCKAFFFTISMGERLFSFLT